MRCFFAWLKWKLSGCPTIQYDGYNCGLCGKCIKENFTIPTYESSGSWWDTWGICKECSNNEKRNNK